MDIPDRLLFGQFLIEKKIITKATLDKAIEIQKSDNITDHPRMLGSILLNDFHVFDNRVELQRYLKEFEGYRDHIRDIYITAKIYGVSPDDKLEQEYAELMEELESAPTGKVRDLIKVIEKFKVAIKHVKVKDDKIIELKQELINLENSKNNQIISLQKQVQLLKSKIEPQRIDNIKQLKKRNK